MNIIIGDSVISNLTVMSGAAFSYRVTDELDSATIAFIDDKKIPYKPFTVCGIQFDNSDNTTTTEKMLFAADSVETYAKQAKKYKHTVTLAELTKILEKFIVPNMVLTSRTSTFYNMLVNAVAKVNSYILAGNYKLILDPTLYSEISDVAGESVVMSRATSREVFDRLFSIVDSRVVVSDIIENEGIKEIYINRLNLNDITHVNYNTNTPVFRGMSNTSETYCGRMISFVSNATPQSYTRQIDTFKVKYGENVVGTDNRIMSLAWPIEYAVNFLLQYVGNISYRFLRVEGSESYFVETTFNASGIFVDAITRFVDKEYWDTLAQTEQEKSLYYERGVESIDVSRTYKPLLTTKTTFSKIVTDIFNTYIANNWATINPDRDNPLRSSTFQSTIDKNYSLDNAIYDLTYAPIIETELVVDKDIDSEDDEGFTIIDNQSDNIIDIERYGKNLLGKVLRTGNDELYIDDVVYSYDNILPVLSEINYNVSESITEDIREYVIYRVDFQVMTRYANDATSNWYKVRYYLSENYNNLAEKISLNREKEIYEIPLAGYKTTILRENTKDMDTFPITEISKPITLSTYFAETLCNYTEANSLLGKPISHCQAVTSIGVVHNTVAHALPVLSHTDGNSIHFVARFYDNYSAGLSIGTTHSIFDWIGGKKVVYNPYVDTQGEAIQFRVSLGYLNSPTAAAIQALPVYNEGLNYIKSIDTSQVLQFPKDRSESITFNLRYKVKATDHSFITSLFLKNNRAVSKAIPALYLWTDADTNYKITDTKCRGTMQGVVENYFTLASYSNTVGIKTNNSADWGNFAIGDASGNLYYANNNGAFREEYFGFSY